MYKLITIETHGFSVFEGTPIKCYAKFYTTERTNGVLAMFLYDDRGVLIGNCTIKDGSLEDNKS